MMWIIYSSHHPTIHRKFNIGDEQTKITVMYLLVKIWGYITPLALECTPPKQANSKLHKH